MFFIHVQTIAMGVMYTLYVSDLGNSFDEVPKRAAVKGHLPC